MKEPIKKLWIAGRTKYTVVLRKRFLSVYDWFIKNFVVVVGTCSGKY